MHPFLLNDILVIILLSVVVLYLCQRMRLPIIVGFLLTGVIAGPHGFALVREIEAVKTLAEAGIVLLLFTIGMEFSFRSLLQIRKTVLLGGSLQIALTILAGFAAARLFSYSVNEAIFAGFLLSLSSTAIVMKTLQDRAEMETPQGNAALGILIFQDMAAVPMMLLVPLLAGTSQGEGGSPVLLAAAPAIAEKVSRLPLPRSLKQGMTSERRGKNASLENHLIIVGFGLNGRNLARAARIAGIPYTIIEMNPAAVRSERAKGEPIFFGDATQAAILLHADIRQARTLVVVINDPAATRRITELARRLNPRVYILVRTRFVSEMNALIELGANDVIPEEFETSVEIFSRVLAKYFIPKEEIEKMTSDIRSDGYEMFRSLSRNALPSCTMESCLPDLEIASFRIENGSAVIGKTLQETEMRKKHGVTLLAVNRNAQIISNPAADLKFAGSDILFVVGDAKNIQQVKLIFNQGVDRQA